MTKGLSTHFAIVMVFHMALLFWGVRSMTDDLQKNNVPKLGNGGAITAGMGKSLRTFKLTPAPEIKSKPVVSKTAPKVPVKTVSTQAVANTAAVESAPQEVSGGAVGTGGRADGHEFGSGDYGTGKFDPISLYKAELRARIDQNKFYPPMSKRLGQTGVVVVAFTLLEDGNITNIRLEKPSRYERLNDSALEAVKKVYRFKPFPKELSENKMDIKVPLKFVTI